MVRLDYARSLILVAFGSAIAGAPVYADEVFSAREFLFTRSLKMGIDLWPDGFPTAAYPGGIYVAGTFFPGSPAPSGPEVQVFMRKYNLSGKELWTRQIAAGGGVFPSLMAVDTSATWRAISDSVALIYSFENSTKAVTSCGPARPGFRTAAITL